MDEQRFDQLSKRFAGLRTRRQAVKAIAGALVATVATGRQADAQSCSPHYGPCAGDGDCCDGAVCDYGLCMPGCRVEGAFVNAMMSPAGTICAVCDPAVSTTSLVPANEGMSCWSGDPNAGFTTCQSGACTGSGPVDCQPLSACHTAAINPSTGQCEQSFAPAGTACGNSEMCHGGFYQPADVCDGAGFCIGGGSQTVDCYPFVCGEAACQTSCTADSECAPGAACSNGICLDFCSCDAAVISASPTNPNQVILVDDDATVYVNGEAVYVDDNGQAIYTVIPIGPVTAGDVIRVVGSDPVLGEAQWLYPLHLHCTDPEAPRFLQTLDPVGHYSVTPRNQPPGVFYDRSFILTCSS